MDCIHLIDSRQSISLKNSSCSLSADDGLNVHANYFNVEKILNQTTILVELLSNIIQPMNDYLHLQKQLKFMKMIMVVCRTHLFFIFIIIQFKIIVHVECY